MKLLSKDEMYKVNGCWNPIKQVVRWGAEVAHAAKAVVDTAQIYVNSKTAEDICGEGKVKLVSTTGFECEKG